LLVAAAVGIGKTTKLQRALQCREKEIAKEREWGECGQGSV
jgi:hypothetical protein